MMLIYRYYSAFTYARYFAVRHLSIIEDDQVIKLVMHSKSIDPRGSSTSAGGSGDSTHSRVDVIDFSTNPLTVPIEQGPQLEKKTTNQAS